MRLPQLDQRLSAAARLFPACAYGADIGADHGRLSCYLLAEGVCQRMCVADVSEKALEKAKSLLTLHGLAERADIVLGDGLKVLPHSTQAVAILGMGGRTLSGILQNGRDRLSGAALILSAHTEFHLVRRTLCEIGYAILEEEIVRAGGRFYTVLRAEPGESDYTDKQCFLGPVLMKQRGDLYEAYLKWQFGVAACGRSEEARTRLVWIEEELGHAAYGADGGGDHPGNRAL